MNDDGWEGDEKLELYSLQDWFSDHLLMDSRLKL